MSLTDIEKEIIVNGITYYHYFNLLSLYPLSYNPKLESLPLSVKLKTDQLGIQLFIDLRHQDVKTSPRVFYAAFMGVDPRDFNYWEVYIYSPGIWVEKLNKYAKEYREQHKSKQAFDDSEYFEPSMLMKKKDFPPLAEDFEKD